MDLLRPTDKITIIGPSESGKTLLAKYLLKRLSSAYLVYDTEEEFSNISRYNKLTGIDWKKREIAYNPKYEQSSDPPAHLSRVCQILEIKRNRMLVLSESKKFVRPHYLPPGLSNLIMSGRHKGNGLMSLAQDFSGLAPILRQSQHVFVFEVFGQDLRQADDYLPTVNNVRPSEVISKLEPYQFVYWPRSHPTLKKKLHVMGPIPL